MSNARVKQIEINQDSYAILVDIDGGKSARPCAGECGQSGKWRFVLRQHICDECKEKPSFKLITRTTVKQKYGLTFEILHSLYLAKKIKMYTVRNPHGPGKPPMHLYNEEQIKTVVRHLS